MQITSLQQTSPGRISIELDDGSVVKSTLAVTTDLMLYSGKEIDSDFLTVIKAKSNNSLALEHSIEYLSRRQMSAKELYEKLITKGNSELTAQYCIDKLTELGLINDEAYASSLSRHYLRNGYGPGKIKSELYRRGVNREISEKVVDDISIDEEKILKIISSKIKDPSDKKQIKKAADALYRRGFSWDDIKASLRMYVDEFEDNE